MEEDFALSAMLPSCPFSAKPKHHAEKSDFMAQVCLQPADTQIHVEDSCSASAMGVGAGVMSRMVSLPSWPYSLLPQQLSVPNDVMAHV